MPLDPEPQVGEAAPAPAAVQRAYRWYHKVTSLVFIVFSMEVGTFLLIFPWTESWSANFFSTLVPKWHAYWANAYLRGAVSGIGVLNLYIALLEIFRLRRFSVR